MEKGLGLAETHVILSIILSSSVVLPEQDANISKAPARETTSREKED